ncbi:MAG: hypothetical protein QXE89_02540 [Pyrobaculum sp.]
MSPLLTLHFSHTGLPHLAHVEIENLSPQILQRVASQAAQWRPAQSWRQTHLPHLGHLYSASSKPQM